MIEAPEAVRASWRATTASTISATARPGPRTSGTLENELSVSSVRRVPPKDQVILRGAERLGWEAAPARRNAAADCDDCGSCPFGCRRGSKQSGIRVHLTRAFEAGARIVPQVRVTKVLIERGHAVGVEGRALVPGTEAAPRTRRLIVRARQVVVAAGALRTPAILQASGLRHRAIGRHLRLHPAPVVAGRMTDARRHVARADAGGSIAGVPLGGAGPEQLRHRIRARASRPAGARPAMGRDRRARRVDA